MRTFYEVDRLPALDVLREGWRTVREEYLALDAPLTPIHRQQKTYAQVAEEMRSHLMAGGRYGWITGWGLHALNEKWLQYGLMAFGRVPPMVVETMPRTLALLDRLPRIEMAAIVKLAPGGALACHRHVDLQERGLLLVHVTIDVAAEQNYAYLNVAGEFRRHELGSILVFDGGFDHFAINESPKERVILYFEVDKKQLLESERAA